LPIDVDGRYLEAQEDKSLQLAGTGLSQDSPQGVVTTWRKCWNEILVAQKIVLGSKRS